MAESAGRWEVAVVGGGHAGIEAALASARLGRRTLLLTQSRATIGTMSCNPSVGGVGKGQIVKELDALGGEMARLADRATTFSQTLNASRGPAVRSPRVQCDKALYRAAARAAVEAQAGLTIVEDEALSLLVGDDRVRGVEGRLGRYEAAATVLTTGTFLNGLAHTGLDSRPAGRAGEAPATGLSASLRSLGLEVGRLKTGTPPRLLAATVDTARLERQDGDAAPRPLSRRTSRLELPRLPNWIAYTSEAAHRVIRDNLDRSPLYSGAIASAGPRYCPSIEDKIVKFPHKDRHQLFVEPEGLASPECYLGGLSTSLPEDAQRALVSAIPGLERAIIARYGYAIEYDFCPPTQLDDRLAVRAAPGLWLAGQINGTTGYEEAAGQGFWAGTNAALAVRGEAPFRLRRDEAYLGVLVDDLVTKGVDEPYRMFTARAEHRLILRADDADLRLMPLGFALGLLPDSLRPAFERYRALVDGTDDPCEAELAPWSAPEALAQREVRSFYAPFVRRERAAAERLREAESLELPPELDCAAISALTREARQKLSRVRPRTLGQASRIPGLSPADLQVLWVHAARSR